MSVFDMFFERYRNARVWINDSPVEPSISTSTYARKIEASRTGIVEEKRIAIEVAIPMGFTMYGLLGGKIESSDGGFELAVKSSGDQGPLFSGALVSADSEEVQIGLSDEYLPAITKSLEDCINRQMNELPYARLTIDVAACGSIGSNPMVFKKLSRVLFDALVGAECPTEESLWQSINRVF
jgi:hypothetical protein